ncbi:MAG: redoxin domain-containing protein [Anaerolineales bacterium]|nr:redoxin domain-containing protein [Anaerolineales bacterium]
MSKVQINTPAPDFELQDFNGQLVRLSELWQRKQVVLVFNRGFV